jgi:SagB-type dehydrogenase family enzyme
MANKVRRAALCMLLLTSIFAARGIAREPAQEGPQQSPGAEVVPLPAPRHESGTSIEKAIDLRRSIRSYANDPLSLAEISQLLWAAQGFTQERKEPPRMWNPKYEWQGGLRTAPSAGALYPMEIYVLAGNVQGLAKGLYKYIPKDHALKKIAGVDKRTELSGAALKQPSIETAAAVVVMAGVYARTSFKYGERAERYVHIEVGSIAENVYLQGMALGIGTVIIGAFADKDVKTVLQLPEDESPLAIMPLGKLARPTAARNP